MTRQALSQAAKAQEKSEKALNEQAKLMLLTAKLNAISSLLDAHKTQIEVYQWQGLSAGGKTAQDASAKFKQYIEELTNVMDEVKKRMAAT